MFEEKFQQNISLIKHDSQIKLRYRKLDENKRGVKTRLANFVQKDDTANKDLRLKINSWKQECKRSELVTLVNHKEQYICKKDTKINAKKFLKAKLDNNNILVLSKLASLELQYFYNDIKLTKVFSPFSILDIYLSQNPNKNCLGAFIYDGFIYLLVTNSRGEYVDFLASSIIEIKEIDKSNFFEDDDSRQELFDEFYALKLREIITDSIKDFYKSKSGYFIEKIHIISDLKQISDTDLDELSQELMLDIHFYTIEVDEYLFKLSTSADANERSFIKTKATKKSMFFRFFFTFLLTLLLVSASVYYVKFYLNKSSLTEKEKIYTIESIKDRIYSLSSIKNKILKTIDRFTSTREALKAHSRQNTYILKRIKKELALIPDDVYLNFAIFHNSNSTLSANLPSKLDYFKNLYPQLRRFYSRSSVSFGRTTPRGLSAIVINKGLLVLDKNHHIAKEIPHKMISYKKVERRLKKLLNSRSFMRMSVKRRGKISIVTYRIDSIVKSPNDFYDLIQSIDSYGFALSLSYPIKIEKFDASDLKIGFILKLLQKR